MHTTQCAWWQGTAMYLGYMKVAWQLWEENWEGGSLVPKSFPPPLLAVCGGRLALWRSGHIQWRHAMEGSTRNMNYYSRPPPHPVFQKVFFQAHASLPPRASNSWSKTSFPLEKNILLKFFTPLAPTKFLQLEPPLFLTTSDQNHFLNSSTLTTIGNLLGVVPVVGRKQCLANCSTRLELSRPLLPLLLSRLAFTSSTPSVHSR